MLLDDILIRLKTQADSRAYTHKNKSYSYRELYQFVCNLYHFLILQNPGRLPVIVYGHKDVYMKASFLACSFAGMAYVPVDEGMPRDRIFSMIAQTKPGLVIGNPGVTGCKNIPGRQIWEIMHAYPFQEIDTIYMKPENIYYILFTSGSTGTPKGVKVTYANLDSCIRWLRDITGAGREVLLNQANFTFDLSVADFYLSLTSGSEHYILGTENKTRLKELFVELKKSRATIIVATPSFADLLLLDGAFNENLMPDLRMILFCGEKLLKNTVEKLYKRFPGIKIINCYGPTECTFAVTAMEMPRDTSRLNELPVGRVKSDCKIIITDEKGMPVSDGMTGEILITGKSVGAGYIGEQENDRFITFHKEAAYRTGDYGFLQDGILYYKCRKDKQVKYKGYRVELADIETNLLELDYIEKAVVTAKKGTNDRISKLIAFVKIKGAIEKSPSDIREDLLKKIPGYMCPVIKIIKAFPINENGKCDEKKLLEEYNLGRKDY